MSTQQAELLRQQKEEDAKNAADLRAAADASLADLARSQAQEQARLSAELDAKLQASVTMIAAPIAHIMDHLKQLHLSLPSTTTSTQDTQAKPSASTDIPPTPLSDSTPIDPPSSEFELPPTPYTPPSQLPPDWVATQIRHRHQAWRIMDPTQPITNQPTTQRLLLNQLRRQFRQGTGRQMTINDLPHWRDLELPPNPTDTNQEQYLQSLGAYLRAHMPPRESHRTFAADPRDPQEAEVHATQQTLREDFQLAILIPDENNAPLRQFLDTYSLIHGYPPQPEDVPLWPTFSFLLPTDHRITPELTQEFHNLMYSRMLPTHTQPIPPPPAPTNPIPTNTASTTMGTIPIPPSLRPPLPPPCLQCPHCDNQP